MNDYKTQTQVGYEPNQLDTGRLTKLGKLFLEKPLTQKRPVQDVIRTFEKRALFPEFVGLVEAIGRVAG